MELPHITEEAARRVTNAFGARGRAWVTDLPTILRELSVTWNLVRIGEPFPGARAGFVAPVEDRLGRKLVVKVAPGLEWARSEYEALAHWNGSGSISVLGFLPHLGATLQGRAVPGESLRAAGLGDLESAEIFSDVLLELQSVDGPPPALPLLSSWLRQLESTAGTGSSPDFDRQRAAALELSASLIGLPSRETLLHGDLHHSNILCDQDTWVAVDPKGIVGPAEAEVAAFLRNPRSRLLELSDPVPALTARTLTISQRLGYDPVRVAGWGYVLAVLAAAWALEDLEGPVEAEKWLRCATMLHQSFRGFAA